MKVNGNNENGTVAQMVEHLVEAQGVTGSIPVRPTNILGYSSVGLERLSDTQKVIGSSPVIPTINYPFV